jgi:hypothetical protein
MSYADVLFCLLGRGSLALEGSPIVGRATPTGIVIYDARARQTLRRLLGKSVPAAAFRKALGGGPLMRVKVDGRSIRAFKVPRPG